VGILDVQVRLPASPAAPLAPQQYARAGARRFLVGSVDVPDRCLVLSWRYLEDYLEASWNSRAAVGGTTQVGRKCPKTAVLGLPRESAVGGTPQVAGKGPKVAYVGARGRSGGGAAGGAPQENSPPGGGK